MTKVLMSPDNPTGWKLEDLLAAIRRELEVKCAKIAGDDRAVARHVLANNRSIMEKLRLAEALQRESVAALAAFAPDQGPTGTPRIGVGADPAAIHAERQTR